MAKRAFKNITHFLVVCGKKQSQINCTMPVQCEPKIPQGLSKPKPFGEVFRIYLNITLLALSNLQLCFWVHIRILRVIPHILWSLSRLVYLAMIASCCFLGCLFDIWYNLLVMAPTQWETITGLENTMIYDLMLYCFIDGHDSSKLLLDNWEWWKLFWFQENKNCS